MKMKGKGQLNGFLDAGSHLRGELGFEDTFRVDGKLTGGAVSDGDLFVGEKGIVDGDVRVGRLFVSGRVEGTVVAKHRVEIAAGGRLNGEVVTPCLVVEEGAFFDGQSKMVDRDSVPASPPAKIAPIRRSES